VTASVNEQVWTDDGHSTILKAHPELAQVSLKLDSGLEDNISCSHSFCIGGEYLLKILLYKSRCFSCLLKKKEKKNIDFLNLDYMGGNKKRKHRHKSVKDKQNSGRYTQSPRY
jgi:hypothetical protein